MNDLWRKLTAQLSASSSASVRIAEQYHKRGKELWKLLRSFAGCCTTEQDATELTHRLQVFFQSFAPDPSEIHVALGSWEGGWKISSLSETSRHWLPDGVQVRRNGTIVITGREFHE